MAKTQERGRAICALTKTRQPSVEEPENLEKEAHKYFDQVVIIVRSGDGGHGSVLDMPSSSMGPTPKVYGQRKYEKEKPVKKEKKTGALKRGSDGSLLLPMGGHGGDVILVADETVDTLLDLHKKKRYNAKRGANVDASGPLTPMLRDGASASTLRISVPIGEPSDSIPRSFFLCRPLTLRIAVGIVWDPVISIKSGPKNLYCTLSRMDCI